MHQQGMEAIIHICPRDRNRIALQGDLLTAHVLGVQNQVVMAGEDMSLGDHIEAKTVGDLDELGLFGAIRSLQEGVDLAGIDLKGNPNFFTGCTMRPWADDAALDAELEAVREKVAAGAQYVITPPVFDVGRFADFMKRAGGLGVPVVPTVFLLKSVGVARYMAINVPGSYISEDLIQRLRKAPDRVTECVKVAGETVAALKDLAQGVLIVTLGWEYRLPAVLDFAGL
jgi:5,10-methylenetetrahydrofolate reductase